MKKQIEENCDDLTNFEIIKRVQTLTQDQQQMLMIEAKDILDQKIAE